MKFLIFSIYLVSAHAFAHPVPYKDSIGVMTWNQSFMSEHWVTYSLHPQFAIAARMNRFVMRDHKEGYFYAPQFNFLAKRWNELHSQSNIYLYGGIGSLNIDGMSGSQGFAGVEADSETRKYFISAKWESAKGNIGPDMHKGEFRLGVAPYEAQYEEIASWLMLQFQYHPGLLRHYAITPLGRFFYKNVLWETGVSLDGDFMLNLMFHL